MRNLVASLVVGLAAIGCGHNKPKPPSPTTQKIVGSRVQLRGVAENWKVGAYLGGQEVWVDLPNREWPEAVNGRTVEVTGTLVERHDLPVFIQDPSKPAKAGMPVPPGTDLHEASRRLVLENVEWKVINSAR